MKRKYLASTRVERNSRRLIFWLEVHVLSSKHLNWYELFIMGIIILVKTIEPSFLFFFYWDKLADYVDLSSCRQWAHQCDRSKRSLPAVCIILGSNFKPQILLRGRDLQRAECTGFVQVLNSYARGGRTRILIGD